MAASSGPGARQRRADTALRGVPALLAARAVLRRWHDFAGPIARNIASHARQSTSAIYAYRPDPVNGLTAQTRLHAVMCGFLPGGRLGRRGYRGAAQRRARAHRGEPGSLVE